MRTYDYVIVGAGSAGSVLANRLTEDEAATVALIEAGGPDEAQEIHIPLAFGYLFKTVLDWDLDTEPEPHLANRRAYLPRGRVFGGSSSINAMIYMRGNRLDYDGWAASGATGWGWDGVLPYFLKAEDNERGAGALHATGGPLTVSDGRSNHPLSLAFVEAAVEAGHPRNEDFNGERQEGVGFYQVTQRDGMRCSAADAYLRPALERENLTVLAGTVATRLVLSGTHATGVEVALPGGDSEVVGASREVILSAGAYESPKLLMLSGIGPEAVLAPLGIPVEADLPAGRNLQDHVMVPLNYRTPLETLMTALTPENLMLLLTEGRGPLASNVAEAGGFFHSRPGLEAPDIQFHQAPVLLHQETLGRLVEHALTIAPGLVAPTSRGEVTPRVPQAWAQPRIFHNYLGTPEDRAVVEQGVRIALDIARRPALREVVSGPFNVPASDSDGDIAAFVAQNAMTLYHPTSTCAIGSVVDPELRVLGFEGLRVVDASVFPTIPRGNTNAPTIMVAERAADLIRGRATPAPRDEAGSASL
ncbi:MAG: GMC family oxidoreductase N-terminal domain-containing protein [Candidatus Dormibacteraeota bacterium]|nr:GMC family oxidoreductase N-terminal domain-containing protein [Candidatus Dormibacteraeota bacterium]